LVELFEIERGKTKPITYQLDYSVACVASVSVGFGSKELQREKWSQ